MKTAQDAIFALERIIALAQGRDVRLHLGHRGVQPGASALCSSDASVRVSPVQVQLVVDFLKRRVDDQQEPCVPQPAPALCPRCDEPHLASEHCYGGAPNW